MAGNQIAAAADIILTSSKTDSFITTWRTNAANERVYINVAGHTGVYTVDWGDGTLSTQSANAEHRYALAGFYNVSISGDLQRMKAGDSTNAQKLVALVQWGNASWNSMAGSFKDASNMAYNATDTPDLSQVKNMSQMFYDTTAFNGDISKWNVSSVADMSHMFRGATAFNGDISKWNVSSVADMSHMFRGATAFNGNISAWDVSSVADMSHMFRGATAFNGNISAWDVSSATSMGAMFDGATAFNGDISKWDVSSVTSMGAMFDGATAFNGNISAWDVSSVTSMAWMFADTAFNGDISKWDVSSVTSMGAMFDGATAFNGNISAWDVSSVTSMYYMFDGATAFNGNISAWDVSSVTSMYYMFRNAATFNTDLSAWDVSSVTDTEYMFDGATAFNGDISKWDVSSVTYMNDMFRGATAFNGNISAWNVSSATDMSRMFQDATAFNGNISAWNVSSATDMTKMFRGATTFSQNLGPWYVVLGHDPLDLSKRVLGNIAAQNEFLQRHNPVYSLINGTGDADNSLFTLSSNTLKITEYPIKSSYSVRIGVGGSIFGQNNAVVLHMTADDNVPPIMSSASYHAGTGILTVSFNEPLDSSKHVASKFHVRNASETSGGVTLSNGTITNNGTKSLAFTLGSTDKATVNAMTTPQLDIDAGAVSDAAGNQIAAAADQTITLVRDTTKPTFASATYNSGTGVLTVTFSEALNQTTHYATKIHVRDTGQSSGGVTLSSSMITTNGTSSITFTLGSTDKATVNAMTTPQLDIDAGAVSDAAGNQIAAAADQTITLVRDTTKPTFASATYNSGTGVLTVTFSEALNQTTHYATKIHVRDTGQSSGGVTLSNSMITTNGTSSITFTLGSTDKDTVNDMATPQLDIEAGAVYDAAGNQIAAAADQTITVNDTIRPAFESATFSTSDGVLAITFSEPLKPDCSRRHQDSRPRHRPELRRRHAIQQHDNYERHQLHNLHPRFDGQSHGKRNDHAPARHRGGRGVRRGRQPDSRRSRPNHHRKRHHTARL